MADRKKEKVAIYMRFIVITIYKKTRLINNRYNKEINFKLDILKIKKWKKLKIVQLLKRKLGVLQISHQETKIGLFTVASARVTQKRLMLTYSFR